MRLGTRFALALVTLCAPALASAQLQTVTTSRRAQIYSINPNTNYGGLSNLLTAEVGGFNYYPLLQYDLSAYAGQQVQGNGVFNIFLSSTWGGTPATEEHELRTINSSWSQSSVTYNNFFATNSFGATLDTRFLTYAGTGVWVGFVISQATLQSWIDLPGSNNGFALENLGQFANGPHGTSVSGHPDMSFTDDPNHQANIQFTTNVVTSTPEPASVMLVGSGLLLVGVARRRRRLA